MILSAAAFIESDASRSIFRCFNSVASPGFIVLALLTFLQFPGVDETIFGAAGSTDSASQFFLKQQTFYAKKNFSLKYNQIKPEFLLSRCNPVLHSLESHLGFLKRLEDPATQKIENEDSVQHH